MKKKELFEEMQRKCFVKKKGDYIFISPEAAGAAIYQTRRGRILNAMVIVCEETGQFEWMIEQGRLTACPKEISICIKNLHEVAVHVGEADVENTYHFLNASEDQEEKTLMVIGVVEIEEEVVAFSFDWKMKEIHYLYLEKEFKEDSVLYALLVQMKLVGGMSNGAYSERANRRQTEKNFSFFENGTE